MFVKKFLVVLTVCLLIAGIFLSNKILKISTGNFLLYTIVPLLLGLLFTQSLCDKNAGVLAFSVVAVALFVYLLLIDKKAPEKLYIISAISAGLGAMVYFFQIRD